MRRLFASFVALFCIITFAFDLIYAQEQSGTENNTPTIEQIPISALVPPPGRQPKNPDETQPVPMSEGFIKPDIPIAITANEVYYDQDRNVYTGIGNVVLTQVDAQLTADFVQLDYSAQLAVAQGRVEYKNPETAMQANAVTIRLDSKDSVVVNGKLVVTANEHHYYFTGSYMRKIELNRYIIYDGTYTTCDCGTEDADWMIRADELDITLDGYAVGKRATFYSYGMPVAFVPYGVFPSKVTRQSGILPPKFGWSSDDGYHFGIPVYWAISDHSDATLYTDYYTFRGLKEGVEYRYAVNKDWKGEFNADYIEDRVYKGSRWDIVFQQQQRLWRNLYLRAFLTGVSDRLYPVDFTSDINMRFDRYIRSDVILNNLWEDYDLNVDAQLYRDLSQDNNAYTWQRAPQIWFNGLGQNIANLPLAWRISTEATNFSRLKISKQEQELDEAADHIKPYYYLPEGRRVRIIPELFAPLNANHYLVFTPFCGLDQTIYQLPNREDQWHERFFPYGGAELYTRLERSWPLYYPLTKGIKHTIEPGVSYGYRPQPELQGESPVFNSEDRLHQQNNLVYWLSNRLWTKKIDPKLQQNQVLKILDLKISQAYNIDQTLRSINDPKKENNRDHPLSDIRAEIEGSFNIGSYISQVLIRGKTDYNIYDGKVDQVGFLSAIQDKYQDQLGLEYRYHLNEESIPDIQNLSGFARYTLEYFLALFAVSRYSFLEHYFIEQIYGMELISLQNCYTIRFQFVKVEIPRQDTSFQLFLDLTGLVKLNSGW